MHDDYRGGGGVLSAFILGGIVGAALGMLFAPRSGREIREVIADKSGAYLDQGKDLLADGRERFGGAVEAGKERVTTVYESGRESAGEKSEELKAKIDTVRTKLREQVGQTADTVKEKVAERTDDAHSVVSKTADAVKSGLDAAEKAGHKVVDAVAEKAATEAVPNDGSGATGASPL